MRNDRTEVQTESHAAYGGVSSWPRGKVLGGSSMLNYMLYMRGHSGDYDEWRDDLGLEGWGYDDVLPYFKKAERMESEVEEKEKYRGDSGPLTVTKDNFKEPVMEHIMMAAKELGYKVGDINGPLEDEGFTIAQSTIHNGYRSGTYKAFAEKHVGGKLSLLTFAHVNKVIMNGKTAVGVEVSRFGRTDQYYARQEVILSAGAVGSPQILMLSGIGDQSHLEEVGVKTVHHLPEVGQNLQDHLIVFVAFDTPEPLAADMFASLSPVTWYDYLVNGNGPLTSTGGLSGAGHVRTGLSKDKRPDIQQHLCGLTAATDYGLVLKNNLGLIEDSWPWIAAHLGNNSQSIIPTINRPESRGYIRLRSSDPQDHPVIQPNYLTVQRDVDTLVAGVEIAVKMLETQAMRDIGAELWGPDPHCAQHLFKSKSYWECYVVRNAATVYHHVGTCSMGTVLDARMRVQGVKSLRVVDGSSMPKIVGGNTNAPIIMMAEKGADMIIQDHDPSRNNLEKVNLFNGKDEL